VSTFSQICEFLEFCWYFFCEKSWIISGIFEEIFNKKGRKISKVAIFDQISTLSSKRPERFNAVNMIFTSSKFVAEVADFVNHSGLKYGYPQIKNGIIKFGSR
jgi:hypothetical protein